ncbi:hypothetical protein F511_31700 [Dorcoceras hygrometricum]|uniref:Uncharacterized protein n=1 Tax=Dorcoceras hygrometricum TaxID=472368 RepID=A0A2Z7B2Q7_9LAMI|nr:hypothetical protein F511_31700 [Dorcoceras hygrometricum]
MHGGHRASPCATLAHGGRPVRNTLRWPARGGGRSSQSGPRPEARVLRQSALEELTKFPRTESPRKDDRNKSDHGGGGGAAAVRWSRERKSHYLNSSDPITMHTSWRSNSDIVSVTRQTHLPKTHPVLWPEIYHTIMSSDNIGYPRIKASGESSTTKHRLLHASGPHPIPPRNDPNRVGKRVKVRHLSCRVSMTSRVVRTNQYNQDLGIIHSTNGNHLESPNEGSSIDHQVTIHLHAQNITMFPTNETWYFASQILVSSSGGLILILTAQSTRNVFRIHSDY